MKTKAGISGLSIFVILFAWTIAASYVFYDYKTTAESVFQHLFSFESASENFFHLILLATIIGSHVTAYLINERNKLLMKTKTSEHMLRQAAHEWSATFDSMPYGILLTDSDCRILRANKYITELSGITGQAIESGIRCNDLICKDVNCKSACAKRGSLQMQETLSYEHNDKENNRVFSESISPVANSDGTTFVHVLIDITDIKEKEAKLGNSKDAFFNMLKDLDSAYKELKEVHNSLIITLSNIIDAKSSWTRGHSIDVANYSKAIAREMGLDDREISILTTAALLHDIGKIGTYDNILDKPGDLDVVERALIREHTVKGEEILKPINGLKHITPIVRSHHERVDGKGYPDGLKGNEIPPFAKILCVADAYDAMVSDRPYRYSRGREYAMSELKRCSGTQFDLEVSNAFLKILGRSPENIPTA